MSEGLTLMTSLEGASDPLSIKLMACKGYCKAATVISTLPMTSGKKPNLATFRVIDAPI